MTKKFKNSDSYKRAEQLTKSQLRTIVSQTQTIDDKKLNKMSKEKLIPMVANLSLKQIHTLLQ